MQERKQEESVVMEKKLRQKWGDLIQIGLRLAGVGASIAGACLMFTCHQTALVYGVPMDAKYGYASAFKFFAFANAIASVLALMSLSLTLMLWRHRVEATNHHFFFFLHDLGVTALLLSGCSAATAIGYVGKHGNSHAGWVPICDHFSSFCHRAMAAIGLSYFSFLSFLFLTVLSAAKYSTPQFAPLQVQSSI
ncbi:hypothetical protein Cgig2_027310 [Carnegiea gigantea]|uniref:CASP-like protein n=1 Tax=Carnegiea gigantea TaxID=171969 RepID=A0A9Q1GKB7_9CARY|nr:hypothetical protein Cgig2_013241 [Carnegiea gigantea]KAJ8420804.1 hypothetical protein Cgig2_027310 [Carnegiea gigantea]